MCSLHAFDGNCVRGKHNGKSGDIPAYFSAPPVRDVTAPLKHDEPTLDYLRPLERH